MEVIGFDAGSIATFQNQGHQVTLGPDGTATLANMMVGTHHPMDGKDSSGIPVIGTSQYRLQIGWQRDGSLVVFVGNRSDRHRGTATADWWPPTAGTP